MRTQEQRLLNAVQRPDIYEEVLIKSRGVPIALSIWLWFKFPPLLYRLHLGWLLMNKTFQKGKQRHDQLDTHAQR